MEFFRRFKGAMEHYALVILGVFIVLAVVVPWWIGFVTILGILR